MLPLQMLTEEEEKFLIYWEEKRKDKKAYFRQTSTGLLIGLLLGIGVILNFISGWYTKATMAANSHSTPIVLILAIVIICIFCNHFYKHHKFEMNEQRFLELSHKKKN